MGEGAHHFTPTNRRRRRASDEPSRAGGACRGDGNVEASPVHPAAALRAGGPGPGVLLWLTGPDTLGLWRSAPATRVALPVLGGALIYLGLVLMVATIRLFVTVGQGTLAPWDPTQRLVV